jgi:hypothetical protein
MVMRNRGDGSNAPHWWDDLPPKVRERFTQPLAPPAARTEEPSAARTEEPPPPVSGGELVGELSRLAVVFALVVIGIILYLFAALYFVYG